MKKKTTKQNKNILFLYMWKKTRKEKIVVEKGVHSGKHELLS